MKLPISVCVITKDEEQHLAGCLESVKDHVDEIVVLDSLSRDRTQRIALGFTRHVHTQPFRDFSSQKNRCVDLASHDWVLVLDADERIPAEAWPRIASALRKARRNGMVALAIPRKTRFVDGRFHRWVAYWPNFQWRLFDRRCCRYVGRVHESLQVRGRRGCVQAEFVHDPDRPLDEFLLKAGLYRKLKEEERADPSVPARSLRDRIVGKLRETCLYARVFCLDMGGIARGPVLWFHALAWLGIFVHPPLRRVFDKEHLWRRRYPKILPYLEVNEPDFRPSSSQRQKYPR